MNQPTKKTIRRQLKLLGLVNRHSDACYRVITLTITSNAGLGSWREIIKRQMIQLLKEASKIK